jgi:sialate O-acetylesterase
MEMHMKALNKNPTQKSEELISTSSNTNIRLFNSEHNTSLSLENDVIGKWEEANPESVSKFSAVGYLFGKKLFQKLQIPIGIIEASWGGTSIECWLPQKNILEYPEIKIPTSLYTNQEKEKKPKPTLLYNAMVYPFRDFSIKGFLWYQGEANRNNGSYYKKYMQILISSWRDQWQQNALPFYFVQIAPFDYNTKYNVKTATFGANLVREAQVFAAQEIVNTGLVVSTDAGKCNDIHPTQKNIIAERLANWALAKQYNFKEIVYRSPEYKGITIKKNKAIIEFNFFGNKNENNKLDTKKELKDFVIAGDDKLFYPATVKINKNQTLTVYSDKVDKPVAVRYGFVDCLEGTLFSNSGLPISAFRTDDWAE